MNFILFTINDFYRKNLDKKMDRLSELKRGIDYNYLEEGNIHTMTNDEIRRKIFIEKIEFVIKTIKK